MINPELIRTFLTLAEVRHFTKASLRLHMTQPGVSQHLKKLEAQLGTELIHREGKSFTLTEAGKKLVSYGNKLFSEHRRFTETVQGDDPHSGACRVSSPGSYAFKLFDTLLVAAKRHPQLKVDLLVAPNASVEGHLLAERVDLGFMSEIPKQPGVQYSLFSKERLLLALPRGTRSTSFQTLKALGYVDHPDGPAYASKLLSKNYPDEFQGVESLPRTVSINQVNRILDPVAEGLGFAILPHTACERFHRRKEIRLVSLKVPVEEPIYQVTRRGERLPRRYKEILRRLED